MHFKTLLLYSQISLSCDLNIFSDENSVDSNPFSPSLGTEEISAARKIRASFRDW